MAPISNTDASNVLIGVQFVKDLLLRDPTRRLSMVRALEHPYLNSHVPSYLLREPELASQSSGYSEVTMRGPQPGGAYSRDMSMEGPERQMDVEPPASGAYVPDYSQASTSTDGASRIPGAYPKHAVGSPGKNARGQGAIVRRAHVLAQAAEEGSQLFQPSQEMVSAEERRRDAEVGRATKTRGTPRSAAATRANKRKQDEDEDAVMVDATPQKRRQAGRGRGRATPTGSGSRTRQAVREDPIEEEDEEKEGDLPLPAPRRSQRKRSTP